MDNVNKPSLEVSNDFDEEVEILTIKSHQSIAESNWMVIPFISMQRTKVKVLKREWESNGTKRGITVVGSAMYGCPTILELDVLMGLFRIHLKNNNYQYEYNRKTGKVGLPQTIHFTYRELARELGYENFGGSIKNKLEKSIKTLIETTLYSDIGIRDVEKGDYIVDFDGQESARILKNYKSYSYTKKKKVGEKIGNAEEIKEQQSVDIDDFFFKNICNNYFKIYDFNQYIKLTKGVSKKLFLLLNQWSHGYEKFLTYHVLYDMLSLDTNRTVSYNNRMIKEALEELESIGFVHGFEPRRLEGMNIIFDNRKRIAKRGLDKYNSVNEVIDKLREYGLTVDQVAKLYRMDNEDYVRAVLRMMDDRIERNDLAKPPQAMLLDALNKENYNVDFYLG